MTTITSDLVATPINTDPHGGAVGFGNIVRWIARQWGWLALALLLTAYIFFLHARFFPAISEPDDNGYFAQGTLLAQTGKTWFIPESNAQYIGMHWLLTDSGKYISRYPPGLAVLIAGTDLIWGWKASVLVNPILSVLALLGMFFLARRAISIGWAVVAVAVLVVNPTFVHHALSGDSHIGVTCVLAWGLYWLIRWGEQGRVWQAFVAGLVLGCIPTIRYADAIMGLGVAVFMIWHVRRFPKIGRHYLAAALGAAVPILPLLIRNQILMGAFWRTGYSLTNEETGFSWAYFKEHAVQYIQLINGNGIGLLFAVGFVGMIFMIFKQLEKSKRALGTMLLLMTVSMLLVYMAYYWAPQMNSAATLRFLLPTFPAYILAGLWFLKEACGRTSIGTHIALGISLITFQTLWGTSELLARADQLQYQKQSLTEVTVGLEKVAKPGDVVVAYGNLSQQLDFVREWKIADGTLIRGGQRGPGMRPGGRGGAGAAQDASAPSPMQEAKVEKQRNEYPINPADRERKFVADLLAWAGQGHKVYFVGTDQELAQLNVTGGTVKIISHVKLPAMPEDTEVRGRQLNMGDGNVGGRRGMGGGGPGGFAGGPPPDGMAGGPPGGPGGPGGGGPMGGFTGETEVEIAEFVPRK